MNISNERDFFINIFEKALSPLKEIDKLSITKNNINNNINKLNNRINRKKSIVLLIVLPSILGFWLSFIIAGGIYGPKLIENGLRRGFKILIIFAILIAIVTLIIYFVARYLKIRFITKPKINNLMNEINKIDSEINNIVDQNTEILKDIPPKYCYFFSVNYMYETMVNQRADLLKEAINIYEDQIHKWKVENYQQQLIEINRQHQVALQNISRHTRNTAIATTIDVIF